MGIKQPHGGELTPFKPGQAGNPKGFSRKGRIKAYLSAFVAEGLAAEIPPEIAEALKKKIEGLAVGEALAGDILLRALAGNRDAIEQIIRMEPSKIEHSGEIETAPRSAEFVPVEDDERALTEAAADGEQIH